MDADLEIHGVVKQWQRWWTKGRTKAGKIVVDAWVAVSKVENLGAWDDGQHVFELPNGRVSG